MIFCRCSVSLLFLQLGFALCYEREDSLHTAVSEGRKLIVHHEVQNNTEYPITIKITTVTRRKHNRHRFPHLTPHSHSPSYQRPLLALPPVPSPIYPRPLPRYSYLAPPWYPPYPPVPYQPVPYPIPPYVPAIRWSQSSSPPPSPSILSDPLPSPSPDVSKMRKPAISASPSPTPSLSPSPSPSMLSSLPSPPPSSSTLSDPLPSPSLEMSEIRQPTISAAPSPTPSTSSDPLTLPSPAISKTTSLPPSLSLSPSPTPPTESLSSPSSVLPPSPDAFNMSQPTISTSLSLLTPHSPADLEAYTSSPSVRKDDFCEVVVFLCNLEYNSDIPEPPAQFCEHFNPSCAATNLLSAPTQTLTWLCQMFPSHWMCNARVKTPNTFCNQFASHWSCLTNEEISHLSVLLERSPERPKQVKWFCQHFPTDWLCEDPVIPPTGFCEKFNTHWACAAQESSTDNNSQLPAGLESFCNLVPTYWMCESPIHPPVGFCEAHPRHWACEIQITNVEAQPPLCAYFPCEDTRVSSIDKRHKKTKPMKRRNPNIQPFGKSKPVRVNRPNNSVYQPAIFDYKQLIADLD